MPLQQQVLVYNIDALIIKCVSVESIRTTCDDFKKLTVLCLSGLYEVVCDRIESRYGSVRPDLSYMPDTTDLTAK